MNKAMIAVDAGGTKTKACAFTLDKTMIYETVGESGSPAVIGEFEALDNIYSAIRDVYRNVKENYQVCYIQVGLSGFGVISDIAIPEDKLSKEFGGIPVSMVSDAVIGIYSVIKDQYDEGILVLSGTGSIVYGIKGEESMGIGGFGHLLTEHGSGYTCVRKLLCDTISKFEETHEYSELSTEFMKVIGAATIYDFRSFMYHRSKNEIAGYSKFINEQAQRKNPEAIAILKQAGSELAHSVSLLYKHLKLSDQAVLGFRGSFIQHAEIAREELLNSLSQMNIYPKVVQEMEDPIFGAYYLALKRGKLC